MTANIESITNNGKKLEKNLKSSLSAIEDIGKSIADIVLNKKPAEKIGGIVHKNKKQICIHKPQELSLQNIFA